MKKIIFFLSLVFPLTSTFAAKGDVTPGLNQCAAVMDSKVYISTEFHAYPREVIFECSYKCNSGGKIQTLTGITKLTVANMEQDANDTVCQGTLLKKVPWGYEFDKIVPFYAADTNILELKRWSFQNINFNPNVNGFEREKLQNLKADLEQMSAQLIMAGSRNPNYRFMAEAGITLAGVAKELPMNTVLLDEIIHQIIVNKGTTRVPQSADSMVESTIKTSAAWRIPALYK
jgi:hypothetical protein